MKVGDRRDDPAEMQLKRRFALAQDTSSPDLLEQAGIATFTMVRRRGMDMMAADGP